MKKIICIILCLCCLLCTVACKGDEQITDTATSTAPTATTPTTGTPPVSSEAESTPSDTVESTPTDTESTPSTESEPTTPPATESKPSEENSKEMLEMLYGFNSLDGVETFCVKNVANEPVIYAVSTILTSNSEVHAQEMNDLDLEITCNENSVTINDHVITIPYSYTKSHSSLDLTATHAVTGLSCDFTINFEKEWELAFEDEFNGDEMDAKTWDHRPEWLRDKGYVNYWSKDMTFVDGEGNLVSRAQQGKKTVKGEEVDAYLSGAISSKNLYQTTYGYFEARVKLHHKTGMWGAFWIIAGDMDSSNPLSDNSSQNGCEIDVFESIYKNDGVAQNLHWDGFTGHTCSAPSNGYVTYIDTFDDEYHTFAVSWTPYEYTFLVDGVVTRRISAEKAGGICDQPGYMLITTECGTWAGDWVLQEGEYSDMLVDYVRVYEYPNK